MTVDACLRFSSHGDNLFPSMKTDLINKFDVVQECLPNAAGELHFWQGTLFKLAVGAHCRLFIQQVILTTKVKVEKCK